MIVILDSGVLGQLCSPLPSANRTALDRWFYQLLVRGAWVVSSEICDYEIRRGLLLSERQGARISGIPMLDSLALSIDFLPINKKILLTAAQIWAMARETGQPTADDRNIDVDLLICGTWEYLRGNYPGREIVIATTNVKHLSRFAMAMKWQDISN